MTRPRRMVLSGVAAGLAEHLGWPVVTMRLLLIALALVGGAGILIYLWLWALTPLRPAESDNSGVHRVIPGAAILVSLAGVSTLVGALVPQSGLPTTLVPGAIETALLSLAAVAWSLGFDRGDPLRDPLYGVVVRSVAAGLMILLGIIRLLLGPSPVTAIVAVLLIVLGSGVLFIPRVVTLWSEVLAERGGRVREEQRAEIAAHLHDSVLQTLALIQNRAGASSEVARLARAQERELRDWLFAGVAPATADLATELRDTAAAIELEYPARLDVVAAGDFAHSSAEILAAAREAMLNAARHAGGEVSVYLESAPAAIDVWVRDRGQGFELEVLPTDRLGIRESIIGRMARAGGSATVTSGPGGTEVHLHLDVQGGAAE